ncbi:LCP family protein required for cell wall assembly [Streptomyces umbrinus]|uniref:LCP family protein required for cell wall assembly n=1 Tax=Streptomyces umbrinus TaxID=67370 RepID=A0ABU0SZR6_9ACTN|nr:LCP family protein [Streptomyces umbrinus]MDQ1028777.1 LCP family protein required for cell wall assembly [Streptomyces umbrinus]
MDAQGRGRADDIDPADQWVLNPNTGDYELRLQSSAEQRAVPGPRARRTAGTTAAPPRGRTAPGRERRGTPEEAPEPGIPEPRRRRAPQAPPPGRRKGRPKKSKAKKILVWTGGTMAFLLVGASVGGYLYYQHLNNNITSVSDDGAGTGGFSKDRAINILLVGTDKRTGSGNSGYGDSGSAGHADTTVVLHVSKDRTNATALSIPRDLITDIPDCPTTQKDGTTDVIPGRTNTRFNNSLGQEGRTPSCTMRTVTAMTGIKLDHFMIADFNAVKTLTSAVEGVEVCLSKDINDPDSKLNLPKGKHTIEGEEALSFVRTRHSVGFGGDLSRIEIQQQFLSSLMRKLKSKGTLTSPTKLVKLAEAGTKALTVDSKIGSITKLRDLGLELGKFDMKNLSFTTVPVVDNPAEKIKATVVLKEPSAKDLFALIKDDVSLTAVKQKEKKEKAAVAARLKGTKADPSEVRVRVLNGGAPGGSAQETLNWLQVEEGVTKSENAGNAGTTLKKTTLEYAPDQADQARRLADLMGLPGSAMKPGKSVINSQGLPAISLTLGEDFKGAGVSLTTPSAGSTDVEKSTADKVECAG